MAVADRGANTLMHADFIVIGAGIAGASVAYELSRSASVIVLEGESQPGYHSTGRSAALFSEIYGNAAVRALSRASRGFLTAPPPGFALNALLKPRGSLFVANEDQVAAFELLRDAPDVAQHTRDLTPADAQRIVPIIKEEWLVRTMLEEGSQDVDVHALHQGYLRGMKAQGASVVSAALVQSIVRRANLWCVTAAGQQFEAPVVINAAGAWADEIAKLAGVRPVGLEPRRRTALLIDAPVGTSIDQWPMVLDVGDTFYFKPDAGRLLLSPADETPSPPCDVQPDDLDVAIAVDRFEQATSVSVQRVRHQWAGLRSFVADRSPVIGFDAHADGFFWLAAQGGYGIQTAPAAARLAAALLTHQSPSPDIEPFLSALSPRRLQT
jgi:D-arginine dehydrogenase